MDEIDLSEEQEFVLARVAVDAQELSREELINALLQVWQVKLLQQQLYTQVMVDHGITFQIQEHFPVDLSEPGALDEIFGYEPSDEEAANYVMGLVEGATMELDMDEIVLIQDD